MGKTFEQTEKRAVKSGLTMHRGSNESDPETGRAYRYRICRHGSTIYQAHALADVAQYLDGFEMSQL